MSIPGQLYVVMVVDRHTDPKAHLFSTPEKAIAYALLVLEVHKESMKYVDPSDLHMSKEDLLSAGWLFYGCYSVEGDCVWVTTAAVDVDFNQEINP